ncbi:tRNA (adenosine(37)-N6)-threonylcarbamoyltransferase complex dimerization subunit type 1 TsaB [Hydrogenovibrio sp. SC-1]|uniref:tRNA (adenosine(37)-N6)-threonylcarbamoyltransferase complex dimerization subunit type 1 TsaB n=1 Tax=Hydrogenovibrio sp. SC-1 TaxID=2065820 RepID=UPI000C7DA910|nr:tRNA (adenosine(37)-N6)-threonylcarbamoyltransferase complex dimerization subunit type 1 TsaB [Hydrogenovibrio sp. SC-1]PLA73527.1 tRNA (adenosine(37)-N6)-threonylcarbamoyltransferase complex dimerization subunit type 1 TsaB [Hydrogenovibrio sp. SC-1]
MMNVLAVESSTKACSVSLRLGHECFTEFEMAPQQHANLMLTMVESVLANAGCDESSIDALAFSEGPGAFTGIRIAAGVVQGLALGWSKPVQAVSTLEAMAWQGFQQTGQSDWVALLDARMHEVYLQTCHIEAGILDSEQALLLSKQMAHEKITQAQVKNGIGDIQPVYPELAGGFGLWLDQYPSAEAIAMIAQQRPNNSYDLSQQLPMPVYLRNNVADKPKAV